jgi:tRNA-specific 2-thiouridylase
VNETNVPRILNKQKQSNTSLKRKVFVALSGGVDSSVAAALLAERGYAVTGIFLKVWRPEFIECPWREDRLDAARVAAHLKIPFRTLDVSDAYKRAVVDEMLAEYAAGRTPNPDVSCNRSVKFGVLFDEARRCGADLVATGHYARVRPARDRGAGADEPRFELLAGADERKDQSYFLWTLGQEVVARALFPVGEYEKSAVRGLARRFGLPTADKPDSQGICFLGKVSLREFLARYLPERPGVVEDESGRVVGEHPGAHLFTLGQRHGFRVPAATASEAPRYVVATDVARNVVTVAPRPSRSRAEGGHARTLSLRATRFISGSPPADGARCFARVRYRASLVPARVERGGARIVLDEPHIAASGQSCVLYDGAVCLGGGIIV